MDNLGENLKKVLLAGVGALAVTAEKSKEILGEMVKKGEITIEQGKVLNEELKHNVKKAVKDNVTVNVKPSTPEELSELLEKMNPEQLEQLKKRLDTMGQAQEVKDEAAGEETPDEETSDEEISDEQASEKESLGPEPGEAEGTKE